MTYWIAKLLGGETISERHQAWPIEGTKIVSVALVLNSGKTITVPYGMDKYLQAKTASADLAGNNVTIESRYIGYFLGNTVTRIRVDETTENISVETDTVPHS